MHSLSSFNDRRAEKRALKAAKGKSKAPRGYKPDTEGRADVVKNATQSDTMQDPTSNMDYKSDMGHSEFDNSRGVKGRKTAYSKAALYTEGRQGRDYEGTPYESKGSYNSLGDNVPVPPSNKKDLTLITGKKAKK
jgi:hypothetical protein